MVRGWKEKRPFLPLFEMHKDQDESCILHFSRTEESRAGFLFTFFTAAGWVSRPGRPAGPLAWRRMPASRRGSSPRGRTGRRDTGMASSERGDGDAHRLWSPAFFAVCLPSPLQPIHHIPHFVERPLIRRSRSPLVPRDRRIEVVIVGLGGQGGDHLDPGALRERRCGTGSRSHASRGSRTRRAGRGSAPAGPRDARVDGPGASSGSGRAAARAVHRPACGRRRQAVLVEQRPAAPEGE
jgi:hypothetical protein